MPNSVDLYTQMNGILRIAKQSGRALVKLDYINQQLEKMYGLVNTRMAVGLLVSEQKVAVQEIGGVSHLALIPPNLTKHNKTAMQQNPVEFLEEMGKSPWPYDK